MKLPQTVPEALSAAEKDSVWMKIRFPDVHSWVNDSYSTSLDFQTYVSAPVHFLCELKWKLRVMCFRWPQAADDLLDDMYLPMLRSGGSWYNWIFKPIDIMELATVTEERKALRKKT